MPPPNATTQCHHPMPPPDQRSTKTKPPLPTFAPESARKCLAAPRVYASRGAGLCLGPRIRMGFDTPVLEVPCAPFRAGSVGHHSRSLLPRRLPIPGLNAASPRVSNIQRTRKGLQSPYTVVCIMVSYRADITTAHHPVSKRAAGGKDCRELPGTSKVSRRHSHTLPTP
jgi:hypothetical protein